MVSTLKERPNGGVYCSECRMSTTDPVAYCPYCGRKIIGWVQNKKTTFVFEESKQE